MIMLISRFGLSLFFTDVFINNPGGELTPALLVKKIIDFKDVG